MPKPTFSNVSRSSCHSICQCFQILFLKNRTTNTEPFACHERVLPDSEFYPREGLKVTAPIPIWIWQPITNEPTFFARELGCRVLPSTRTFDTKTEQPQHSSLSATVQVVSRSFYAGWRQKVIASKCDRAATRSRTIAFEDDGKNFSTDFPSLLWKHLHRDGGSHTIHRVQGRQNACGSSRELVGSSVHTRRPL